MILFFTLFLARLEVFLSHLGSLEDEIIAHQKKKAQKNAKRMAEMRKHQMFVWETSRRSFLFGIRL
jgi:hypothetical protein